MKQKHLHIQLHKHLHIQLHKHLHIQLHKQWCCMQYIMFCVLMERGDKMAQNVFLFRNSNKNLFLQFFTIVIFLTLKVLTKSNKSMFARLISSFGNKYSKEKMLIRPLQEKMFVDYSSTFRKNIGNTQQIFI